MTPEEKLDALPARILAAVERATEARRRGAEVLAREATRNAERENAE